MRDSVPRGWRATTAPPARISTSLAPPQSSTERPTHAKGTEYVRPSKATVQSIATRRSTTTSKGSGSIERGRAATGSRSERRGGRRRFSAMTFVGRRSPTCLPSSFPSRSTSRTGAAQRSFSGSSWRFVPKPGPPAGLGNLTRPDFSIEGQLWSNGTRFTRRGHVPEDGTTGVGVDTIRGLETGSLQDRTAGISFLSYVVPSGRWPLAADRKYKLVLRWIFRIAPIRRRWRWRPNSERGSPTCIRRQGWKLAGRQRTGRPPGPCLGFRSALPRTNSSTTA